MDAQVISISEIIGKNIDSLREQNDISVESLAALVDVTRQTMTSYIKGRQVIDSGKLAKLAQYFNKPLDFFFTEDHQEVNFMFRADNPRENFDPKLSERIAKKIIDTCDLLELWGQKRVLIPESYKLRLHGKRLNYEEKEQIEEIALKKRDDFGISDVVPENIYLILQENEINLISFPFNNDSVFAVSAYSEDLGSFIVVNDDAGIPEERKIFSAVHELGHLIFHRDQYSQLLSDINRVYGKRKDINEEVANHFAMCFLVNNSLLRRHKSRFKNKQFLMREVLEVKSSLKVSAKCLIYALEYYGYINSKQKGIHIGYLNKKGYATKEPQPMNALRKDIYWENLIKELYRREDISLSKICELLNLSFSKVREITREWVTADEPETVL